MYIHRIIILSALFITGLQAADNMPNKITFETYQINAALPEREAPRIVHTIDLNHRETNTNKTFKTLINNAHRRGLPWVFAPTIIMDENGLTIEYLDIIELLRTQYSNVDLSSQASFERAARSAKYEFAQTRHPALIAMMNAYLWCVYPCELGNSVVVTDGLTSRKGHPTELSDARCCAAITLYGDYSKALIFADRCSGDHHENNPKLCFVKNFWINFCNTLPVNIRKELALSFSASDMSSDETVAESEEELEII